MSMAGMPGVTEMAVMGLITSVLAPATVVLTRRRMRWTLLRGPVWLVLPAFVLLHAVITLGMPMDAPLDARMELGVLLLLGAIAFWLPVLGSPARLDPVGATVYLFLAMPLLDLAGVWTVARGDAAGGLAMIVGMLPIGVIAVVLTWRWITAEEAQVRGEERAAEPSA
jgi:hypothetical protein